MLKKLKHCFSVNTAYCSEIVFHWHSSEFVLESIRKFRTHTLLLFDVRVENDYGVYVRVKTSVTCVVKASYLL